jgi:hypothetical protein
MGIDYDSICFYGLAYEYNDIKHIKQIPDAWTYIEITSRAEDYGLHFSTANLWYDCDFENKKYLVGIKCENKTPEELIAMKDNLINKLGLFCEKFKLMYYEPTILSYPNIW